MRHYTPSERAIRRKVRKQLKKRGKKVSRVEYEDLVAEEEERMIDALEKLL